MNQPIEYADISEYDEDTQRIIKEGREAFPGATECLPEGDPSREMIAWVYVNRNLALQWVGWSNKWRLEGHRNDERTLRAESRTSAKEAVEEAKQILRNRIQKAQDEHDFHFPELS